MVELDLACLAHPRDPGSLRPTYGRWPAEPALPGAGSAHRPHRRQAAANDTPAGQPGRTANAAADRSDPNLGDFRDFSEQLEDVHDGIHGWVGGTMGIIAWAAYDPIFWSHHAMIDRLWAIWQVRHAAVTLPAAFLNQALPPFPLTVGETLSTQALGYDYAAATTHVGGPQP